MVEQEIIAIKEELATLRQLMENMASQSGPK
jgi:hypothetical protein